MVADERIMIVEDEGVTSWTIKVALEAMGYSVVGISMTGEEAVEMALVEKPDLILMDIILKGEIDGIMAAYNIRKKLDVPVIFVTAHASADTVKRASVTEPYAYIIKPFTDKELRSNIETALYKHKQDKKVKRERTEACDMNRVMVNRELHMRKIKEENERLKEKLIEIERRDK